MMSPSAAAMTVLDKYWNIRRGGSIVRKSTTNNTNNKPNNINNPMSKIQHHITKNKGVPGNYELASGEILN